MASQVIRSNRVFWLAAVGLVALILAAACGGPAEQKSGNQQSSSELGAVDSNKSSQEGAGSGGNRQESSSVGAGSSGSQNNQATASGTKPSSGSMITGYDACASYSWLAGAVGFSYQSGDGSRVDSSKTPPSDWAAAVGKFAEDSLKDVLDGDVSAACFIESKTPNYGSVYVALSIRGTPPTRVASAVGEAMKKRGANVLGSYSATSPEGTYDIVMLQGTPVETPNNLPTTGGLYFITTQEGVFQAVMMLSYTDVGGQASSGSFNAPAAPASTRAAFPTLAVTPVTPTGTAGRINDDFKPALEKALKTDLIVQNFFQSATGGNSSVNIFYVIDGQLPAGVEPSAALSKVAQDLGGTVSFAFSSADSSSALFEGVKTGDLSVDGSLVYLPTNKQVAVTLTSINNR